MIQNRQNLGKETNDEPRLHMGCVGEQHQSCPPHREVRVSQISHEPLNERGCSFVVVVQLLGEEFVNRMGTLNNRMSNSEEHGTSNSWISIAKLFVHSGNNLRVHKSNSSETLSDHCSHSFFVTVAIVIHQDGDNGVEMRLETLNPIFSCPKKANSFLEGMKEEISPSWDLLNFTDHHREVGVEISSNDSAQCERSSRLDLF
mmetsp:Transcript_13709/g.21258  ORF Transcript_13709/g.21258 Transcript_13709/m.21258 type:complete len:202 (+) Transcript_13709:609-1214(+)